MRFNPLDSSCDSFLIECCKSKGAILSVAKFFILPLGLVLEGWEDQEEQT